MISTLNNSPHIVRQKKNGFSLIEAAIVLGVVGLVIGGIWIAASTVTTARKWNTTMEFCLSLATNLHDKWGKSTFTSLPAPLGSCAVKAGFIPQNMVNPAGRDDCASGSFYDDAIINPLTGLAHFRIQVMSGNVFTVHFQGLDSTQCAKFISMLTARAGASGRLISWIGSGMGPGWQSTSFPVSYATAKPFCTGASSFDVTFAVPQ